MHKKPMSLSLASVAPSTQERKRVATALGVTSPGSAQRPGFKSWYTSDYRVTLRKLLNLSVP